MTPNLLDELEEVMQMLRIYDDDKSVIGVRRAALNEICVNFLRTHAPALADMAKRLEAVERDARRYRWLRSLPSLEAERVMCPNAEGGVVMYQGRELDKRIDATQEGEE